MKVSLFSELVMAPETADETLALLHEQVLAGLSESQTQRLTQVLVVLEASSANREALAEQLRALFGTIIKLGFQMKRDTENSTSIMWRFSSSPPDWIYSVGDCPTHGRGMMPTSPDSLCTHQATLAVLCGVTLDYNGSQPHPLFPPDTPA